MHALGNDEEENKLKGFVLYHACVSVSNAVRSLLQIPIATKSAKQQQQQQTKIKYWTVFFNDS